MATLVETKARISTEKLNVPSPVLVKKSEPLVTRTMDLDQGKALDDMNVIKTGITLETIIGKFDNDAPQKINNLVQGTNNFESVKVVSQMTGAKQKKQLKRIDLKEIEESSVKICQYGDQSNKKLTNVQDRLPAQEVNVVGKKKSDLRIKPEDINEVKRKYLYADQIVPSDREAFINEQLTIGSRSNGFISRPTGTGFKGTWGLNGFERDKFNGQRYLD